jgi:hypothetical protein
MSLRTYKAEGVDATVNRDAAGRVYVSGRLTRFFGARQTIRWMAPQRPHRGISFNGSGLPFHNADQAFEGSPNIGTIDSPDGSFSIAMATLPSAYYTGLGSTYVPPVVLLETAVMGQPGQTYRTHVFLSPTGIPFRWIAGSPPGARVEPRADEVGRSMFYNGREDLGLFQNQEMLLRYKGYPSEEAFNQLPDTVDKYPWINTPSPA